MLRFIDSCDHYATGDLSEKYTYSNGTGAVLVGQGRRGTNCLAFTGGASYVSLTFEAQPRWIVGLAVRWSSLTTAGTPGAIWELLHGGVQQVRVMIEPEGFVAVQAPSGTTLGRSAPALHNHVWYYLESDIRCHATTGEVTLRVDGVEWLHLTGVNTQPTAGILPNQVSLGSIHPLGVGLHVDDIYICDGQGSGTFAGFLGDCRVDVLRPNADGTHTAWTPSSGATHFPTVDEPTPNDDTDYVSETTAGGRDSYQLEPLPTMPSPTVLAVQACISARKEDVDEIRIAPLLVSGGVTSVASTVHELNASYKYALDLWTADPNGGGAWTEAAINSLQVGMERPA